MSGSLWTQYRVHSAGDHLCVEIGLTRYVYSPSRNAHDRLAKVRDAIVRHLTGTRAHDHVITFTLNRWPHGDRGIYRGSVLADANYGHSILAGAPRQPLTIERI